MKRFTFGAQSVSLDPWNIRKATSPLSVVEADSYTIGEGFVTFLRQGGPFLSIPVSKVGMVGELGEDDQPMFGMVGG